MKFIAFVAALAGTNALAGHAATINSAGEIAGNSATDAEVANVIAFLEGLTDPAFLTHPAYADLWPADHPAVAYRVTP